MGGVDLDMDKWIWLGPITIKVFDSASYPHLTPLIPYCITSNK